MNWWDLAYVTGRPPWDTGLPPIELVELVEKNVLRPCRVIDLGCGTGGLVSYLAEKGFETWGVDISRVAIGKAIKRVSGRGLEAKLIYSDIFEFRPPTKFDLVTDVGCYHSLQWDHRYMYPELIKDRYLRDGGCLMLWVMSDKEPDWGGPNRISRMEITENFRPRGFKIIKLVDTRLGYLDGPKGYFIYMKI
jgi:cyclopropane fatty-acyl-phospholipid synthase-like methyltransferase